jgi:hypothetical protein
VGKAKKRRATLGNDTMEAMMMIIKRLTLGLAGMTWGFEGELAEDAREDSARCVGRKKIQIDVKFLTRQAYSVL